jgi:hypothetical protein
MAAPEQPPNSTLALAFGQVWLFFVGRQETVQRHGKCVARVGPIPVDSETVYTA